MKTVSSSTQLVIRNLTVSTKKKQILYGINAMAKSGELLAVMGPTGAGKTTLLNAIAGRVTATSGEITLDGHNFNKQLRRRLGYVLQEDIFMSRLTLYETLYFTAMIHISESVPWTEKLRRINDIVDSLDLRKCLHTVIGDILNRGLSGGEKKRTNIACELLTDPDIMLIDEPTSGIDSSTAHTLMIQLRNYATNYNKAIIATIHQPSSQVFHMFCKLLLLLNGHVAYFGKAAEALDYFEYTGFTCAIHFNPADFLLELLKSDDETKRKILEATAKNRNFENMIDQNISENGKHFHYSHASINTSDKNISIVGFRKSAFTKSVIDVSVAGEDKVETISSSRQWTTSFWTQYRMLTWRQFKQSKGHILHKVDVMRALMVAVLVGLTYFQLEYSYKMLRDKFGTVFFSSYFWGFECFIQTVESFPAERGVIRKERNAGAYRLSAYYFAKISSDLPLILILPVIFLSIIYWMSAMGDGVLFCIFVGINFLNCLIAQAIGHIIGAATTDFKLAMSCGITYMLASSLLSGFLNAHLPYWLQWAKYISLVHYPYACLDILSTEKLPVLWCNTTSGELFPACSGNATYVSRQDVLRDFGIDLPYYCYIATMGIAFILLRVAGYYVLKWKR